MNNKNLKFAILLLILIHFTLASIIFFQNRKIISYASQINDLKNQQSELMKGNIAIQSNLMRIQAQLYRQ